MRKAVSWACAALVGLLAACGSEAPPPRHGLEVTPLEDRPVGELLPAARRPTAGVWQAVLLLEAEDRTGERPLEQGVAELHVRQEVLPEAEALRSEVSFRVVSTTGFMAGLLEGLDGASARILHDQAGRPRPETLALHPETPPGAADFFRRFWLAGFGGSRPWLPEGPLRVGASWRLPDPRLREALAALARRAGGELTEPVREGGARLERVEEGGRALVRLELLTEVEGRARHVALSVGNTVRGEAWLDVATGQPVRWEVEERLRMRSTGSDAEPDGDVTFRFRGTARFTGPANAEDGR